MIQGSAHASMNAMARSTASSKFERTIGKLDRTERRAEAEGEPDAGGA